MIARLRSIALSATALVGLAACASTGGTYRSGVGDTMLRQPPWIAGQPLPAGSALLVLPATVQTGATQPHIFERAATEGPAMTALLAGVNQALDSVGRDGNARRGEPIAGRSAIAPDVYFGCVTSGPAFDCLPRPAKGGLLSRDQLRQRLAVGRPSREWVAALQPQLDDTHTTHALVITLEVGQLYPNVRGLTAAKTVLLGRNHEQPVPWVSDADVPVMVLQLTAAVVDREGRAVRIAAEGLAAKRTGLLLNVLEAQSLWSDKDIEQLRTAVREDLPGRPLVWRQALDDLLIDIGWR